MFGADLAAYEVDRFEAALLHIVDHSTVAQSALYMRRTPQFQQALAVFDAVFDIALRNCQELLASGQEHNSLLALLFHAVESHSGKPLTVEQLREEILFIFSVGFENVATGLTKALRLLMEHPDKLAKLQEEVSVALGDELPSFNTLSKLEYSGMAFQEALRLHPPASWLMRAVVKDDEIDGHPIPAGATVIVPTFLFHHDPELWPNPDSFEPERFAPARSPERHSCAWLPFGAGQRFCLGRDFALIEGKLILAMTIQRFDFATE
jgi:cytochrome P450